MSSTINNIPLICTAFIALVVAVLLTIIKIRKTAKVSFITYLSLAVIIFACIKSVLDPYSFNFNLFLLLACVLLLPYCIMLAFGKKKIEVQQVEETEISIEPEKEIIVEEIKAEEVSLVEKGEDFIGLAAKTFSQSGDIKELLDNINKTSIEVAKADGGAVLMVDDFDDVISVKSFIGNFPPPYKLAEDLPHKPERISVRFKNEQFSLRDNIFGEVATAGKPELITDTKGDERIYQNGPEDFLKLGSLIFVPLKLHGKDSVVGLLALSRNAGKDPFTENEFNWVKTLSGFAEVALQTTISFRVYKENQELTKESDIASDIQKNIIPKKLPPLAGLSVGSFFEQTAGVCSDAFDVIPARQDRLSFVLMDVAGKGMNSLLCVTMIRAMLRLIVNTTQSAGTILSWANRGLCSEGNLDRFASVALINYNPNDRKVQFSSSGNISVMRFSAASQKTDLISVGCEPMGVEKTSSYKDIEFSVGKGDILIAFTDGVNEALNQDGKQYSIENIKNIVNTNNKLQGNKIADLVKADMKKFIGSEMLHDDQTLLVIKIQ